LVRFAITSNYMALQPIRTMRWLTADFRRPGQLKKLSRASLYAIEHREADGAEQR